MSHPSRTTRGDGRCAAYRRKIAVQLRPEFGVSRPTVQAYMREMGIFALVPGPHTSKPAPQHQIYPYLLRNVTAARPNHIWGIDITYIRLQHSWLYLTAVLDWYSRYVVSWALSQTLEMDFVLTAVDNALFQAKPEIWNSDQGSHFTSPKYLERLQREEIKRQSSAPPSRFFRRRFSRCTSTMAMRPPASTASTAASTAR